MGPACSGPVPSWAGHVPAERLISSFFFFIQVVGFLMVLSAALHISILKQPKMSVGIAFLPKADATAM